MFGFLLSIPKKVALINQLPGVFGKDINVHRIMKKRRSTVLEEPIRIGRMRIKNRLVKAAIVENLATEDGQVTDELIRLYDKAAHGGAGLIITGGAFVQLSGRNVRFQTGVHSDELIPGLARLARAGQENDARIVLQISHGGRQCPPSLVQGDVIGPSPVRDQLSKVMPRTMTEDEIEETIEAYFLDNVKQIGSDLDIPVILVGGLRTPDLMEEILQKGYADMIALGRPLIRQPDWPNHILAGDSRPSSCINCNRCFIRISQDQPVRCYATGAHNHDMH